VAREHIGWEPRMPYRQGLAETIGWFRSGAPEYAAAPAKTAS
jgi:dTDP-glucose 4,6-dehydratase